MLCNQFLLQERCNISSSHEGRGSSRHHIRVSFKQLGVIRVRIGPVQTISYQRYDGRMISLTHAISIGVNRLDSKVACQ